MTPHHTPESRRLAEDARREKNWKRWGPYLSERQWGTVREDYSADGSVWAYFPHDHARSRAYRWGEDGLLGLTDRECRLCFGLALWNGRDPILKERLFGLTGPEGNHGEDVKERYYYIDATPTHYYNKALYKYTQQEYPYSTLVTEIARRESTYTAVTLAFLYMLSVHSYCGSHECCTPSQNAITDITYINTTYTSTPPRRTPTTSCSTIIRSSSIPTPSSYPRMHAVGAITMSSSSRIPACSTTIGTSTSRP